MRVFFNRRMRFFISQKMPRQPGQPENSPQMGYHYGHPAKKEEAPCGDTIMAIRPKRRKTMAKEKYYITTAIAYTSGKPHIGNTYEAVLADSIARFKRQQGYDVFFQTVRRSS